MFSSLFSILFFIASGYLCKRLNIIAAKEAITLINFVIYVAIPALIIEKIHTLTLRSELLYFISIGIIGTAIGAFCVLLIGRLMRFSRETLVTMMMMSSFGNTLFMGLPMVSGLIGEGIMQEALLYDQIATMIPVSLLGPVILAQASPYKVSTKEIASSIIRFPPMIALIVAFALQGVPFPEFFVQSLKMLGATVTPLALFAIGLQMVFASIGREWRPTLIILVGKMLLAPLTTLAIMLALGFSLTPSAQNVILLASTPPMVLASAMVIRAGLNGSLSLASIALGVVAMLFTAPLLFSIIQ